jgi:hypothetical protein
MQACGRAAISQEAGAMITAQIPYTVDTGEPLVNETFGPNNIQRRTQGQLERISMPIEDGRAMRAILALETNGFVLVDHPTRVDNFFDEQTLRSVYYPEVERLIKQVSGAARVVIFDHTLRSGDEAEREVKLVREPVLSAHNDYTEWSGPQRVREIMGEEADALLARRFAIIQVWRAIAAPIESNPLALADARSVAPEDLLIAERRYPNRVGQTYRLKHNRTHRWFYFPHMRRDEAIVFKVYDSQHDGRARFTPHTAIDDPNTPPGAPARQSIEARALVFF